MLARLCVGILAFFTFGAVVHTASAAPIIVAGSAMFTPRGNGKGGDDTFTITNGSTEGVNINQIKISLVSPLTFDTAGNGSLPFTPLQTGTAIVNSPVATVSDGGNSLVVDFASFGSGTFEFSIDVDGKSDNVNAQKFAGSTIALQFSGPFSGSPLTTSPALIFVKGNEQQLQGNIAVTNSFSTQVQPLVSPPTPSPVPEPASLAVFGAVLGLGAVGARFRRKAA
jgi:hypothetical protein